MAKKTLSYFKGEQYIVLKAIIAYANDAVFKNEFWSGISYQTECVTEVFSY